MAAAQLVQYLLALAVAAVTVAVAVQADPALALAVAMALLVDQAPALLVVVEVLQAHLAVMSPPHLLQHLVTHQT